MTNPTLSSQRTGMTRKQRERMWTGIRMLVTLPFVAIIMTKCDLMKDARNREERLDRAEDYINQYFMNFANNLAGECKSFGINRANNYMPYILTFSLGDFYVGNTVLFDGDDSEEIIKFISAVTRSVKNDTTSFFG